MTILNLDEMLNASLENVQAAPDFITPETGVYILKVNSTKAEQKESKADKGKYILLQVTYTIEQIIEQEGTPIRPGSLFSESFMYTEKGLPYFKSRVSAIAVANGGDEADVNGLSVGEALEAIKGMEFKTNIKVSTLNDRTNIRLNHIRNSADE